LKRILFIASHRKDRAPNQRFRFEQYFSYLEKHGYQCELAPLITASEDKLFYSPGGYFGKALIALRAFLRRLKNVLNRNQYDIIFIAREAFMTGSIFFEQAFRKSRAKIIFDFDDSIWIDVVSENNKSLGWLKDASKTSRIITLADMVFAGNAFLADYARQFNSHVAIIPTTIDTDLYRPQYNADKRQVIIGWSGSTSTIEHFVLAVPALKKIKERYGDKVQFKVIGNGNYRNEELQIQGLPWQHATELDDLRSIDIGIMPLPDSEWANGKCGLKGLQYMALEIPTIMSPVGVNREIIQDGINGFLAETSGEWVEKLSRLIDDPAKRVLMGKAGRKTVEEQYSVKSEQQHYLKLFNALTAS